MHKLMRSPSMGNSTGKCKDVRLSGVDPDCEVPGTSAFVYKGANLRFQFWSYAKLLDQIEAAVRHKTRLPCVRTYKSSRTLCAVTVHRGHATRRGHMSAHASEIYALPSLLRTGTRARRGYIRPKARLRGACTCARSSWLSVRC